MIDLRRGLMIATLTTLLVPAGAHAQFFGGPSYYNSWPSGYGFGGTPGWGGSMFGGFQPFGGSYVTGPQYFSTGAVVAPIVYSVSTPAYRYDEPRVRPALYPAIPYRDAPVAGDRARIDVRLPSASAAVWFDGVRTEQTGTDRHFLTPPLDPGASYSFDVRASWRDSAGKEQIRTQRIIVRAGAEQSVNFVSPP